VQPVIRFLPDNKKVQVKPGTTIFQAGKTARVAIRSRCGGKAACLMCKVHIGDQSGLAPANRNERNKLGALIGDGYRLSCQARVWGSVTVTVPEDPLKIAVRAQLAKRRQQNE